MNLNGIKTLLTFQYIVCFQNKVPWSPFYLSKLHAKNEMTKLKFFHFSFHFVSLVMNKSGKKMSHSRMLDLQHLEQRRQWSRLRSVDNRLNHMTTVGMGGWGVGAERWTGNDSWTFRAQTGDQTGRNTSFCFLKWWVIREFRHFEKHRCHVRQRRRMNRHLQLLRLTGLNWCFLFLNSFSFASFILTLTHSL